MIARYLRRSTCFLPSLPKEGQNPRVMSFNPPTRHSLLPDGLGAPACPPFSLAGPHSYIRKLKRLRFREQLSRLCCCSFFMSSFQHELIKIVDLWPHHRPHTQAKRTAPGQAVGRCFECVDGIGRDTWWVRKLYEYTTCGAR